MNQNMNINPNMMNQNMMNQDMMNQNMMNQNMMNQNMMNQNMMNQNMMGLMNQNMMIQNMMGLMNQNKMGQNMMNLNIMNNNQFMMNNNDNNEINSLNKEGSIQIPKDKIIIDNTDDLFISVLNQINIRKKQFENKNQNGVTIFINFYDNVLDLGLDLRLYVRKLIDYIR